MSDESKLDGVPADPAKPAKKRVSAEYKAQILAEADACQDPAQVVALLAREGLKQKQLKQWRWTRDRAKRVAEGESKKEVASLTAEIDRLQKRLGKSEERLAASEERLSQQKTTFEEREKERKTAADARLEAEKSKVAGLRDERDQAIGAAEDAQRQAAGARKEAEAVRSELAAATKNLEGETMKLAELNVAFESLKVKAARDYESAAAAIVAFEAAQKQTEAALSRHDEATSALNRSVIAEAQAREQAEDLSAEIEALRKKIAGLERDAERLKSALVAEKDAETALEVLHEASKKEATAARAELARAEAALHQVMQGEADAREEAAKTRQAAFNLQVENEAAALRIQKLESQLEAAENRSHSEKPSREGDDPRPQKSRAARSPDR
jgi:chromosome segregation ATPase